MKIVNIHEAKTHLSRLIQETVNGEAFVIAKAGKPLVRVVAVDAVEPAAMRRLGFMADQFDVPDDFNHMGEREIDELFGAGR